MKKIIILIALSTISLISYSDFYTIYAHGIVNGPTQVERFEQACPTDQTMAVTFDDCTSETGWGINRLISEISTRCGKPVNRSKMYMGQLNDIEEVHKLVQSLPADAQIILYGCSRGAATIINYLSKYNPSNVNAVVLDACPAGMPETTHPALAKIGLHHSWDNSVFSTLFPAYPRGATTPLAAIANIQSRNLPILLIHSQADRKVPFAHSLALYKEFKDQRFKKVLLAPIKDGRHSFLLQDEMVKNDYLQAVHSFYKVAQLPHDPAYAIKSIRDYEHNTERIAQRIAEYEQSLQETYEQSKFRNQCALAGTAMCAVAFGMYKRP